MSNVVGLRGEATPTFEPDPDTVAKAEKILDLARSGEIIGIQVIALHRDGAVVSPTLNLGDRLHVKLTYPRHR